MPVGKADLTSEQYRSVWKNVDNDVSKRFYLIELRERDPERFQRLVRDFPRKPIASLAARNGKMTFSTSDEKAFGRDMRWLERQAQEAARRIVEFKNLQSEITQRGSVFVSLNRWTSAGTRSADNDGNVVISINPEKFSDPLGLSSHNEQHEKRRLQKLFDVLRFEMINAVRIDEFKKTFINPLRDGTLKIKAASMPELSRSRAPLTIAEFLNPLIALDKTWTYDVLAARVHEDAEYPTWPKNLDIAKKMANSEFFGKEKTEKKYNVKGKMRRPPANNQEACINFQVLAGHTGSYVYDIHQSRAEEEENNDEVQEKWEKLDSNVGNFHRLDAGTGSSFEEAKEENSITAHADHHLLTRNFQVEDGPYHQTEDLNKFRDMMIQVALKNEIRRRYMASPDITSAIADNDITALKFNAHNFTLEEDRQALAEGYNLASNNADPKVLDAFHKAVSSLFPHVNNEILHNLWNFGQNSLHEIVVD